MIHMCIKVIIQETEHTKVWSYFTNKWKTRFVYQKSLNKNILLNTSFSIENIFFIRKKNLFEYKNFLNTSIFWLNINMFSLNDKILTKEKYFFWLNVNIYGFLDKKMLNIKMYFCIISANIVILWKWSLGKEITILVLTNIQFHTNHMP